MKQAPYEIRSLENYSREELYAAHIRAFKNYPFQWNFEALMKTMDRRGFNPALSFGAFYEGQLVSFTFNGTGLFNEVKSVYDTGTGTVEEHRGKGLASKIFEFSIPFFKAENYKQYILEVLSENEKAFSVYKKQGFEIVRELDCFRIGSDDWTFNSGKSNQDVLVSEISYTELSGLMHMTDFPLSWQNSLESIGRQAQSFVCLGAFSDGRCVGFGVCEPSTGDITVLAVDQDFRRRGIGSRLLFEMKQLNQSDIIKVVNIDNRQSGILHFLEACRLPKIVMQYEMVVQIAAAENTD